MAIGKARHLVLALLGAAAAGGCAGSYPVVGETDRGEVLQGEATASLAHGRVRLVGESGLVCDGAFNALTTRRTVSVPLVCSDGRTGVLTATRQGEIAGGTGQFRLSDGTAGRVMFGSVAYAMPLRSQQAAPR